MKERWEMFNIHYVEIILIAYTIFWLILFYRDADILFDIFDSWWKFVLILDIPITVMVSIIATHYAIEILR